MLHFHTQLLKADVELDWSYSVVFPVNRSAAVGGVRQSIQRQILTLTAEYSCSGVKTICEAQAYGSLLSQQMDP